MTTERTAGGATIPSAIRTLIPRIPPIGGLAMKAVVSALVLVGVLAVTMGDRQPSAAGPPPAAEPPAQVARAPGAKAKSPDDVLAKKVREAQEKAIKYLTETQKDAGHGRGDWEDPALGPQMPGGTSALATLALLESHLKPGDVVVARGLEYLRTVEPKNTYVVSLQTQALVRANQKADADRIKRNVAWLEKAAVWDGANLKGWSYTAAPGDRADNSNSRYAVAGLYAAHRAGFKVSGDGFWTAVRDLYVRTQLADGGWGYVSGVSRSTQTMSTSGVLCLTLATDVLGKDDKATDRARSGGFGWLASNFRLQYAPQTFYNFDVIAALGRASEKKDFGTRDKKIDWYREGAEWLMANQKPDGSWKLDDASDRYPVISTSFALRFLASRPD